MRTEACHEMRTDRLCRRGVSCRRATAITAETAPSNSATHTRINRLLVGRRGKTHRKNNAAIATYLNSRNDDDQIEVRMSDRLHDRVLIEPDGSLSMLGTSMNGVGRKATVLMAVPDVAAQPLTAHYETLWNEAEVLYPVKDEGEDSAEEPATDEL